MEMDKIRELIQLVQDSQIQEIELSQRGETIRISKGGPVHYAPAAAPPAPTPLPAPAAQATPGAEPAGAVEASGLRDVPSPIVGTFYSAASPESAPFVEVGQRVNVGDVLCIVEAMKVMNEIEAEFAGVVREIAISNGQPVEFGQVLFRIQES